MCNSYNYNKEPNNSDRLNIYHIDDVYVMLVSLGKDFTDDPSVVTIPASPDQSGVFEIPANFTTIDDDEIDEFDQSFILVAEIGDDVPDSFVCFQRQAIGDTGCLGRAGATEIRIVDNDGEQQQNTTITLPFFNRCVYFSAILTPVNVYSNYDIEVVLQWSQCQASHCQAYFLSSIISLKSGNFSWKF